MQFVYIDKMKTKVTKFKNEEYGRTGGGWEDNIQGRLCMYILSKQRIITRIVEYVIVYIVYLFMKV